MTHLNPTLRRAWPACFLLLSCLWTPVLHADLSLVSGSGSLQEWTFSNTGVQLPANETWAINPSLNTDNYITARGSSTGSYTLTGNQELTVDLSSIAGPGPAFLGGTARLDLTLNFDEPVELQITAAPPSIGVSLTYGTTLATANLNGLGEWSGDWPVGPGLPPGFNPDFWQRGDYVDTVMLPAGNYNVSLTTFGTVANGNLPIRGSASVTFAIVPEPGTLGLFTVAGGLMMRRRRPA